MSRLFLPELQEKKAQPPRPDIRSSRQLQVIQVQVVFGRPSQNCSNFGICRLEPDTTPFVQGRSNTFACNNCQHCCRGFFVDGRTRCLLLFLKRTITPEAMQRYFSGSFFVLEEDFILPKILLKRTISGRNRKLKRGNYLLEESESFYYIRSRK